MTELQGRLVEPTPMRRAIARRMSDSKREAPHFYVQSEIEMDLLHTYLDEVKREDPAARITMTAALARATVETLRAHPRFNAVWTDEGVIEIDEINLGIAIAVEGGLLAPAILDATTMTLDELAVALRDLADRARGQKLRPRELTDATFTLSNLGAYPVSAFCAIITPPQVAILATARPVTRCVLVDGTPTARSIMTVTLSSDHRVVDGVDAAAWLGHFKALAEDPNTLFGASAQDSRER